MQAAAARGAEETAQLRSESASLLMSDFSSIIVIVFFLLLEINCSQWFAIDIWGFRRGEKNAHPFLLNRLCKSIGQLAIQLIGIPCLFISFYRQLDADCWKVRVLLSNYDWLASREAAKADAGLKLQALEPRLAGAGRRLPQRFLRSRLWMTTLACHKQLRWSRRTGTSRHWVLLGMFSTLTAKGEVGIDLSRNTRAWWKTRNKSTRQVTFVSHEKTEVPEGTQRRWHVILPAFQAQTEEVKQLPARPFDVWEWIWFNASNGWNAPETVWHLDICTTVSLYFFSYSPHNIVIVLIHLLCCIISSLLMALRWV